MPNIFENAAAAGDEKRKAFMEAFWANGAHRIALSMYNVPAGVHTHTLNSGAQAIIELYPDGTWILVDAR